MHLALLLALLQEVTGPEFTAFELSRERIRSRVTVDGKLLNGLAVDLDAVRITVMYFDGDRELRRSATTHLPRLAAGSTTPLKIETEQVEKFDRFEVLLVSGDRRFVYLGTDLTSPPTLLKVPAPKMELKILGETRPKTFPGDVGFTATVRNLGVVRAREAGLLVTLLNAAGQPVHRTYVRLAELEPQTEDVFLVGLPALPEYASLKTSVSCVVADIPTPADPIGTSEDVEVGRCRLARLSDGAVRVSGTARNGKSVAVAKVNVEFKVGGITQVLAIPETLRPGAQRPFEIYVPGAGKVEEVAYAVSYDEVPAPKDDFPPRTPSARRTESKRLEGALPSDKVTVEVRGLKWIAGPRRGVDIAFLRLLIRDKNGQVYRGLGTFTGQVTESDKAGPPLTRPLTEAGWAADVDDLAAQKARPESVAADSLSGEILIGLVQPQKAGAPLRVSGTLTLQGAGIWEWKALKDPFQTEARGPDRQ